MKKLNKLCPSSLVPVVLFEAFKRDNPTVPDIDLIDLYASKDSKSEIWNSWKNYELTYINKYEMDFEDRQTKQVLTSEASQYLSDDEEILSVAKPETSSIYSNTTSPFK